MPWSAGRQQAPVACATRRCLGWRPTKEDGSAGDYEWLTYREVAEKARVVATALAKLGFKPKGGWGASERGEASACAAVVVGPVAAWLLPCSAVRSRPARCNANHQTLRPSTSPPADKLGICSANNVEWMLAVRGAELLSGVIGARPALPCPALQHLPGLCLGLRLSCTLALA